VLYVSYFHGQLDAIPTALLFLSVVLLFRGHEKLSFAVLGVGFATKTHLFIALPLYLIYLYRNRLTLGEGISRTLIALGSFLAMNIPFLSLGFFHTVFNNPEQQRLFSLFIPFGFRGLQFFLAPALLLLILYLFASYKRLNQDSLLLTLGLTYTVLISLVPPMQGWFYWSLPFLVFFFVKFRHAPLFTFWMMQVFFVLYFVFTQDADTFESLTPTFHSLAAVPAPFALLALHGVNSVLLENVLFTALETSIVVNALWAYRVGISSTRLYQGATKPLVIGIAGDSGVGKSVLGESYTNVVGERNIAVVHGDDVHKWERGHENWKVMTHLNPKSNYVHLDLEQLFALLQGGRVVRKRYNHHTGTFDSSAMLEGKKVILFEGLMPFVLERMRDAFTFKIYIEADEAVRAEWKQRRDIAERGYVGEVVARQIEARRDDAERFVYPQKAYADLRIRYEFDAATNTLGMAYAIKNSFYVENIIDALAEVPGMLVTHHYLDLEFQAGTCSGSIAKEKIEELAYKLFPNLLDVVENTPVFHADILGIQQLFFLGVLTHFYEAKETLLRE
jgi:uridine kinase